MADIGTYAERAADEFLARQESEKGAFNLGLSRDAVVGFIKAAFFASLIPDEGRWPSVCLMSYLKSAKNDFHLLFDKPRNPTASEIAKLAHATGSQSHICCLCTDGRIELGGIHVTMLNELREFGYSSFRHDNPLKLHIQGPGHIEMSSGGIALVYRAGEILQENLFQFGQVVRMLGYSIAQVLEQETKGAVESLEDIFNDLAEAIVRLGHGGMIIVVKAPSKELFSSQREIDCALLRNQLIHYWDCGADMVQSAGGLGKLHAKAEAGIANPHALAVASATAMLENGITSLAHLAGVDGAIVLDYGCNVIAFNAIIDTATFDKSSCRLVDQHDIERDREVILRNKGSRHKSALSFAIQVPHSFVFVVSQDGGVSAFHNPGDGTVVCETGMRVLT